MSRILSLPPQITDLTIHTVGHALGPADGELVIMGGQATAMTPYAMTVLRAVIDAAIEDGDRVTFQPPTDTTIAGRLAASGFMADLWIDVVSGPDAMYGGAWPGIRMRRIRDPGDLDPFAQDVWAAARTLGPELAGTVAKVAEECADNVLRHSDDDLGALALLELTPNAAELVIADRGIGVRAALDRLGRSHSSDLDALQAAVGLRGPSPTVGLPHLMKVVARRDDLRLTIRSGFGEVHAHAGSTGIDEQGGLVHGTTVVLRRQITR
jgi:anti-sigma regulatory factor (Ser/Thr protein kinase)